MSKPKKIYLIDGSSYIFRAFFGLRQQLATSKGFPTNALYGFINMLQKVIRDEKPDYLVVAFDSPDKTFRLLNEVVRLFIEDSANTKINESRSAYNFIEQQVTSYKNQLLFAEDKLKIFKSTHLDGTEAEVESRISMLRNDIEDMKIINKGL